MARVYLSLGANSGDRAAQLRWALSSLAAVDGLAMLAISRVYETEPVGGIEQSPFLNLAAAIETRLSPEEFLEVTQAIETAIGRTPGVRWGPRVIDIDIILWDDAVIDTQTLKAPHPEFRNRVFVLAPLREIAGDARDPITGMTVNELAARAEAEGGIIRVVPLDD